MTENTNLFTNPDEYEFDDEPVVQDTNEDEDVPYETGEDTQEADPYVLEEEKKPQETDLQKRLRKELARVQRQNRELTAKLNGNTQQSTLKKPTLKDFDFDEDRFNEAMESYVEKKAETLAEQRAISATFAAQYKADAKALNVRDFAEMERSASIIFSSPQQQSILQAYSKNVAKVVYFLGKNPTTAQSIADETDDRVLIRRLVEFEHKIDSRTQRSAPPAPAKTLRQTATVSHSLSGSADRQLAKLMAEAQKTGNFTKVMRYEAQLRK